MFHGEQVKSPGQLAFEAYHQAMKAENVSWQSADEPTKAGWEAAADAVVIESYRRFNTLLIQLDIEEREKQRVKLAAETKKRKTK